MCASRAYKAKKRQLVEDQVSEKFSMEEENRRKINLDNVYVMTPRDAAAYLGVGKTTIYRYLSDGQFKALRLQSKTLIRKEDLDSLFVTEIRKCSDSPAQKGSKEVKLDLADCYDVKADVVYMVRTLAKRYGIELEEDRKVREAMEKVKEAGK